MPEGYNPRDTRDPSRGHAPGSGRDSDRDPSPASFDPEFSRPTQPPSFPLAPSGGAENMTAGPDDYTLYDVQLSPYGADPYGRAAPAPMWGPPAQPLAAARPTARPRGGSRALLWITIGVLAMFLLAVGAYAALNMARQQLDGPGTTLSGFCGDVQAQRYDQAYARLGGALRSTYAAAQFSAAMSSLDHGEGRVTACAPAGGASPAASGGNASVIVALTRATTGALRGTVRLANAAGAWQITSVDTSLLGVNLGAVVAVDSFCAALQGKRYAEAYGLLAASAQAGTKADDYTQMAQWHDAVDGSVGACDLAGVGKGAADVSSAASGGAAVSDTAADVTLGVTRSKLGQKQGAVALAADGDVWKLTSLAPELQGSDLGALVTGGRYCAALKSNNSGALNDLVTPGYWLNMLWVNTVNNFTGTRWTGCTLDAATFKLSGSKASYGVSLSVTKGGNTSQQPVTFQMVQVGDAWKLDNIIFPK